MKNIILVLSILSCFFLSCNGQSKDKKKQIQKPEIYSAKCKGDYSTGEKTGEKEKKWTLSKIDIDKIVSLSEEINENDLHFTYPITPCNINVENYFYKGNKYNVQINGGSYLSLYNGKNLIILGCDSPECNKYFLKAKENMDEKENKTEINETASDSKSYSINLNNNKILDFLMVKKKDSTFELYAKIDGEVLFNKEFICDNLDIQTNTKYNQNFNLILSYTDQYKKVFRKIVIPVYFKNNEFFIEKIFVTNLGTNAKTGDEKWFNREINKKSMLLTVDIDSILTEE